MAQNQRFFGVTRQMEELIYQLGPLTPAQLMPLIDFGPIPKFKRNNLVNRICRESPAFDRNDRGAAVLSDKFLTERLAIDTACDKYLGMTEL